MNMESDELSVWTKRQGVTDRTAWEWFRTGRLPVSAWQLATGTMLVEEPSVTPGKVAIYARVSSTDQHAHLDGQIARCVQVAHQRGLHVDCTCTEIGSGLNGHRRRLLRLLADPQISTISVEHRDRLMRCGVEYVEAALRARGARLLVVNEHELNDDLVQDMIDVLTSCCARLCGRRTAAHRAKQAMAAIEAPLPQNP